MGLIVTALPRWRWFPAYRHHTFGVGAPFEAGFHPGHGRQVVPWQSSPERWRVILSGMTNPTFARGQQQFDSLNLVLWQPHPISGNVLHAVGGQNRFVYGWPVSRCEIHRLGPQNDPEAHVGHFLYVWVTTNVGEKLLYAGQSWGSLNGAGTYIRRMWGDGVPEHLWTVPQPTHTTVAYSATG